MQSGATPRALRREEGLDKTRGTSWNITSLEVFEWRVLPGREGVDINERTSMVGLTPDTLMVDGVRMCPL